MRQRPNQLTVFETARAGLVKVKALMFFASALLQTKMIEDPTCETAWTDMTVIGYNPSFIEGLDVPTAKFVIIHELMHILLKHGLRLMGRDPIEWNKACLEASTQIRMADGSLRPISSIRQGEKVWSPTGPSIVLANIDRGIKPLVRLDNVLCTADHRFLTEKGFVNADSLNTGMHGALLRETGGADIRFRESQEYVDSTTIESDRSTVFNCSSGALQERATSRPLCEPRRSISDRREFLGIGTGLSGWDHRWRGDVVACKDQGQVFQTTHHDFQHLCSSEGMVGEPWLFFVLGQEQRRAAVVAYKLERLYHRQAVDEVTTLLSYQSQTLRSALRVHLNTQKLVEESGRDGSYVRNCLRNSLAERAWATCSYTGAEGRVFDLVTEHHVFSAGGFLTHNCDFAINIMLQDLGFKVWQWALIDPKYRGMSAEQIYAARQQEQAQKPKDRPGQPGQGQGQGQGKGQPQQGSQEPPKPKPEQGGLGGDLRPVPAPTAEKAARIEHEINKTLARAAAIAREHGVMPGNMEAVIGATYEDQVPWKDILIDYMSRCLAEEENWSRRNRRYSEVILPSRKSDSMNELVVIADSSGSMFTRQIFERIAVAINYVVTVIKPMTTRIVWADDCECSNVDVFEPGDEVVLHPKGGGGTDLRKPLRFVEQYQPEVCLLFTDAATPWPQQATPFPLIIGCTTDLPCPDWAGVVRITVGDESTN